MKFSLIIGTLNRSIELSTCLNSLKKQKYKDFEIIIVDQSKNELTKEMIKKYTCLNIIYKQVYFTGLSKARNYALQFITGSFFCLIDDDAIYDEYYLYNINELLKNQSKVIVSGQIWDLIEKADFCKYSDIKNRNQLTTREIFRYCPSAALTFPSQLLLDKNFFDENLGVGTPFSSGEETDCLLFATRNGYKVVYAENVKLSHPSGNLIKLEDKEINEKVNRYAKGQGALFCKKIKFQKDKRVIPYFIERLFRLIAKKIISYFQLKNNKELNFFLVGYKEFRG